MPTSVAKALAAPAVLGLAFTLSPSARAEEEEEEEPKPVNPKVVLVVESRRQTDAKAARDFAAYMSRKLPDKRTANDPTFAFMDPTKSYFEYSSCASLPMALKQAPRDGAFAIAHVEIISRKPHRFSGGSYRTLAKCAVYLPDDAKGGRKAAWRVSKARMSPDSGRDAGGVCLLAWFPQEKDPPDFTALGNDLALLLRDAAIEFRNPKVSKGAGGARQIRAEVRNNTAFVLVAFGIDLSSQQGNVHKAYGIDCTPAGGVPPGEKTVTVDVTGKAADILGARDLRMEIAHFSFRKAEAK